MPTNFPELESYFQRLTDITDNIATINTPYGLNHDQDFQDMDDFYSELITISLDEAENRYYELFTSYFTFHIKIIEEIIKEAREILDPDKRVYLKKLVAYKKQATEYFQTLKKRRKSSMVTA